jgi:low affinity Fe/Cu permease
MSNKLLIQPDSRAGYGGLHARHGLFTRFAHEVAVLTGRPQAFLIACAVVLAWALTGPLFNFSDTWQLVINTSTTIVTFLMVFMIQNTQNRDTLAIQLKLSELILVTKGAPNRLAILEEFADEELERLHEEFRSRAEEMLEVIQKRKRRKPRKSAAAGSGKSRKR